MTKNVLCDEFAERLADLLERDVDEVSRAALEAHALGCDNCGALLADLRKLRIDAASLPPLTPSRDLWAEISGRIDAPVIPLRVASSETVAASRPWRHWVFLSAAAAVLIAATSMTTHYLTLQSHRSTAPARVATSAVPSDTLSRTTENPPAVAARPVDSAANSSGYPDARDVSQTPARPLNETHLASNTGRKPSAEQVYAIEIARLHTIVEQRRNQLDPATVAVIEHNLKVIDDAIAQCRIALGKDPASRFLMESLNSALETKVELLRTAALLPSHS